jgi:tetratricopeptide (TPR) repeat protein
MDVNAPTWLATIERELDNLRTALRWQLGRADTIEAALRLGLVFAHFFYWRDWLTEGRWWLDQIVAQSAGIRTEARATILGWTALIAAVQGDTARAIELREASLQLCQELQLRRPRASALLALGTIYARQGDYPRAIAYLEESLEVSRELDNPDALSNACYMLAGVLVDQGRDIARALALYEECLTIARQHRLVIVESMTLAALGIALALTGDLAGAAELLPEALRMQREMNATMAISWTLQYIGLLSYLQADYTSAQQYLIESLVTTAQGGAQYVAPSSLEGLAGVASAWLQPERAARLLGAAEALREGLDLPVPPIEQAHYNHILTNLRGQLPAGALREAWQAGRLLTLEQAIAEATAIAPIEADQPAN